MAMALIIWIVYNCRLLDVAKLRVTNSFLFIVQHASRGTCSFHSTMTTHYIKGGWVREVRASFLMNGKTTSIPSIIYSYFILEISVVAAHSAVNCLEKLFSFFFLFQVILHSLAFCVLLCRTFINEYDEWAFPLCLLFFYIVQL